MIDPRNATAEREIARKMGLDPDAFPPGALLAGLPERDGDVEGTVVGACRARDHAAGRVVLGIEAVEESVLQDVRHIRAVRAGARATGAHVASVAAVTVNPSLGKCPECRGAIGHSLTCPLGLTLPQDAICRCGHPRTSHFANTYNCGDCPSEQDCSLFREEQ